MKKVACPTEVLVYSCETKPRCPRWQIIENFRDNNLDGMFYVMFHFLCDYLFFRKLIKFV